MFIQRFFAFFVQNWRVGVLLMAILTMALGIMRINSLKDTNASLNAEIDALKLKEILQEEELRQFQKAIDNILNEKKKMEKLFNDAKEKERSILNEPESENGAVSPILRRSLERLRHNS
jgi:DNA mismatch repair ATPase MutS